MRMLGRLREGAKAPQASQARPAPHFVGRLLRGQSPRESLLAMRGGNGRSEVGGAFPFRRNIFLSIHSKPP